MLSILQNLRMKIQRLDAHDRAEAAKPAPRRMLQGRMGRLKIWADPDTLDKEASLPPPEKIAQQKDEAVVTAKAEIRDEYCWRTDLRCPHKPTAWVRQVQFDIKNEKAGINQHIVSSDDYTGPIPGLCLAHIADAPKLAEAVYFNRPEIQWGFKPQRWFVVFTDGHVTGGDCLQLDPKQLQPTYKEG